MNLYTSTTIKTLLCLLLQTYVIYNDSKKACMLIMGFLVLYNAIFLVYIKYKSDVFRTRFLRKHYRPSCTFLIPFYLIEVIITGLFYWFTYNHIIIVNYIILLVAYLFKIPKRRKTIPLEPSGEFFKIAFLLQDYLENNEVVLRRGDVVQILEKKGENIIVRSSRGNKYTISGLLINDDIDLVI